MTVDDASSDPRTGRGERVATSAAHRLGWFGAAVLLAGFAFAHDVFRDSEGFVSGGVAFPLGLSAAALLLALAAGQSWERAGRWAALAVAGQGAFLTLVDAGNMVRYQHLLTLPELGRGLPAIASLFLVLQAVVLAAWARAPLYRVVGGSLRIWGVARSILIVGVFAVSAATLSQDPTVYGTEIVLATFLQGLILWTVVMASWSLTDTDVDRLGGSMGRWLDGSGKGADRLPWLLGAWTVLVAALLSWFAYQRHPHVPDEVVYILHARYFAAGLLELPLPPLLAAFDLDLMTVDPDRWFSPVPPGWPAMLAVGMWLGVPWLVNPILGGLSVVLTYHAVLGVYRDTAVARLAVLLMATSPWFLFMSMNFMTHTFTLVTALVAVWGVARMVRGGSWVWAFPAGAGIGLVALNRPLEGLIVATLLGFWSLLAQGSPIRTSVARTFALAGATLATVSVTFPYNRYFTGSATHFPIMDYTDRMYGVGTNAMGFGANRGLGWPGLDPFPGHGFIDVLVNGNLNLFQVNVELLGWGVGSLLILALLVFGRRMTTPDWMMLGAVLTVVGAHSFYWFSGGPDFGARYWYLILVPCLTLAARGLIELGRPDRAGGALWAGAATLMLGVVLVFVPWRAIDKYHHYRGMRPDMRVLSVEAGFGDDALVLVNGRRHPDYASAGIYNPLDLSGPGPLYVWNKDPETTRAALTHFHDRQVWLVDGPTVSGAGFEVVRGPVSAADLLVELGEGGQ